MATVYRLKHLNSKVLQSKVGRGIFVIHARTSAKNGRCAGGEEVHMQDTMVTVLFTHKIVKVTTVTVTEFLHALNTLFTCRRRNLPVSALIHPSANNIHTK